MSIRTKETSGDITGVVGLGLVGIATAALLISTVGAYQRVNQKSEYGVSESSVDAPSRPFTARGLAEIHLTREFLSSLKIPPERISGYTDHVMMGKLDAESGSIRLAAVAFNRTQLPQTFLGGSITVLSDAPFDPAAVLKPVSDTELFPFTHIVSTGNNSFTIDFKPAK